jgi:hypothetical protein
MLGQFYEVNFSFFGLALVPFFYGYETVFLEGEFFRSFLGLFTRSGLIVVMYVVVAQRVFN